MNKTISLITLYLLLTTSLFAQMNTPANPTTVHRIVMQLSSNDTLVWKGLMNNLKNLKAGWGDSVAIEVVAHGPGLELLMSSKSTQLATIQKFTSMGIPFFACENTMREKGIKPEAITSHASFVRMGVGHVVIRQEQGWSYIKAGF